MKLKVAFLLSLVLGLFACSNVKNVKTDFGEIRVTNTDVISIAELVNIMDKSKTPYTTTLKAPLSAVCQNAGCWVQVAKPDGKALTIRFKNHFTIPPSTPIGTESLIHGVAYWDTVSVKALRHYAEDAGKTMDEINKITQPEFKLNFEGDGIKLLSLEKGKNK